jgi:hypothetical protein
VEEAIARKRCLVWRNLIITHNYNDTVIDSVPSSTGTCCAVEVAMAPKRCLVWRSQTRQRRAAACRWKVGCVFCVQASCAVQQTGRHCATRKMTHAQPRCIAPHSRRSPEATTLTTARVVRLRVSCLVTVHNVLHVRLQEMAVYAFGLMHVDLRFTLLAHSFASNDQMRLPFPVQHVCSDVSIRSLSAPQSADCKFHLCRPPAAGFGYCTTCAQFELVIACAVHDDGRGVAL